MIRTVPGNERDDRGHWLFLGPDAGNFPIKLVAFESRVFSNLEMMVRKPSKIQMVKPSDLKVNEEFAPKADPVFTHLLVEAVRGRQPVHFAIVEFKLLKRFDNTHRPELLVSGKKILAQIIEMWPEGQTRPMWVYQSGDEFIASDDYFTFAAYEQKKLDRVPCFVFGTPAGEGVTDIQGPLTVKQTKQLLGFD